MYQTYVKNVWYSILVSSFGIRWVRSAPVAGNALGWVDLRWESLREDERGAHVGLGRGDTPSKRRTVRKLDGGTYYDSRTRDTDITETSECLESRVLRFICFSGDRRLPLFCDRIVISN